MGEQKKGDLSPARVYKFKMVKQLALLACLYRNNPEEIYFLAIGTHESFYRDLKRSIN